MTDSADMVYGGSRQGEPPPGEADPAGLPPRGPRHSNPLKRPRWIITVDWLEHDKLHEGVVVASCTVTDMEGHSGLRLQVREASGRQVLISPAMARVIGAATEDAQVQSVSTT